MTLPEALKTLGVRPDTLSAAEKTHLDREGYLPLPGILNAEQIAGLIDAAEAVYAREGTGVEGGPAESSYMQNKPAGFDICFTHPRVLAAVCHLLDGPIKSFGVHGRPHPPGSEQQKLHVDYNGPPPRPGRCAVSNSIWMLSDFTEANGATRVIPGTHLREQTPDVLEDPAAPHPEERLVPGKAGTVVVINSHMWHGTTRNGTDEARHSLTSFFCRRDDPHMVFSSALSREAAARLGPEARCLFADPEPWTA